MTTTGTAADAARAEIRELIVAKGHSVDNARAVVARLEEAFAAGDLVRTEAMTQYLADLMVALEQDEDRSSVARAPRPPGSSCVPFDRELDNA